MKLIISYLNNLVNLICGSKECIASNITGFINKGIFIMIFNTINNVSFHVKDIGSITTSNKSQKICVYIKNLQHEITKETHENILMCLSSLPIQRK